MPTRDGANLLVGEACTTFLSRDDVTLVATFPCGAILEQALRDAIGQCPGLPG